MSPRTRRDGLYAALPVLAFLSLSCFTPRLWQSGDLVPEHPAPPARYSQARYSKSQILALSDPLCRALSGHKPGLQLQAERQDVGPSEQSSGRFWDVYARDAAGRHVAYLKWDDDTGRVWVAACPTGRLAGEASPGAGSPLLGRREAVEAGQRWLRLLWGGHESVPWRLAQVTGPEPGNNQWHLVWHAGRQRASVSVDSRSGGLLLAKHTLGV